MCTVQPKKYEVFKEYFSNCQLSRWQINKQKKNEEINLIKVNNKLLNKNIYIITT